MLEFARRKWLALRVILGVSMKYAAHFAFVCTVLTTDFSLAQELLARWQFEDTTVSKCLDESSSPDGRSAGLGVKEVAAS